MFLGQYFIIVEVYYLQYNIYNTQILENRKTQSRNHNIHLNEVMVSEDLGFTGLAKVTSRYSTPVIK